MDSYFIYIIAEHLLLQLLYMQLLLYLILISTWKVTTIILFKFKSLNAFQCFLLPDISNTLKYIFTIYSIFTNFLQFTLGLRAPTAVCKDIFSDIEIPMHAFTAGRNSEVFVSTSVLLFRFVHRIQKRNRDALVRDLKRSNEVTGVSKESFLHPRSHLKKYIK